MPFVDWLNALLALPILIVLLWNASQLYELKIMIHRDFATKADLAGQAKIADALLSLNATLRELQKASRNDI